MLGKENNDNKYMTMKKAIIMLIAALGTVGCMFNAHEEATLKPDLDVIPVEYDDGYIYLDLATGKRAQGSQVYEYATYFFNGHAIVQKEAGCQILDKSFAPINKGFFSQVSIFSDGVAYVVEPGGHIIAIDETGKGLFSLKSAEQAFIFHDGVSVFHTDEGKYGLVNKEGKILITPSDFVDMAPLGSNGMIAAALNTKSGKKWGVITYDKKEVIPFEYDSMPFDLEFIPHSKGIFIVGDKNDRLGVVDTKNSQIVPMEYESLKIQPDGNFLVEKNYSSKGARYGWLDKNGNELIAPLFTAAQPFNNTNYTFAQDPSEHKFGIIDKQGNWVYDPKFEYALTFSDDKLAVVRNSADEYGAVNEKGEYVIKPRYDWLRYLGNGYYIAGNNEEEGIIDSKGESIVRMSDIYEYELPDSQINSYFAVTSEYIDVEGIVDQMVKDLRLIESSAPSREQYEKLFDTKLDEYGWKIIKMESKNNYSVYYSSNADYNYEYDFYDGYVTKHYLTGLKVDFNLDYRVSKGTQLIYNELAKRLGIASRMDKDGNVSGDNTFKPSFLKNCSGTLEDGFEFYFTPDSGKIE